MHTWSPWECAKLAPGKAYLHWQLGSKDSLGLSFFAIGFRGDVCKGDDIDDFIDNDECYNDSDDDDDDISADGDGSSALADENFLSERPCHGAILHLFHCITFPRS